MKRTQINHLRPHTCAGQLESPRSDSPAHDDGASILGHRLQTPWTFWFSRKDRRRSNSITAGPSGTVVIDKKLDKKEHMEHLVQIGTCRTVEEFWQCAIRSLSPCSHSSRAACALTHFPFPSLPVCQPLCVHPAGQQSAEGEQPVLLQEPAQAHVGGR